MDVYGRNTNCVASIVGVQIAVISKEMKFILGRLHEIHLLSFFGISFFFWILDVGGVFFFFVFQGGFERVNLIYAIVSFASIFPSVPIYLCLYRYFARNSCLFEILVFLNLKVFFKIFLKAWYFGRCIGNSQLCKFVSISEAVVIGTLNIFWLCFSAIMFRWIW
jgi:hypothetical protein